MPPQETPTIDGASGAGDERFPWDSLVSRVIHPIQVALIEAMLWIEMPLAPVDITPMFGGEFGNSHIAYHARALVNLGVVALVDTEAVRGATKHYYALVPESQWP